MGELHQKYNDNILGRLDMGLEAAIYQKAIHSFRALGQAFSSWKANFSELTFT